MGGEGGEGGEGGAAYAYFDDIVCISLADRTDRREHARGVFDALDIPARFLLVDKHPLGGVYGCFDSHVAAIRDAYERGIERLLVFEDDIIPTDTCSEQHVRRAERFMESSDDWEIFYFGYFVFNFSQSFMHARVASPHVVRYSPFATHAYCINRKGMRRVLDLCAGYIGRVHFDIFLAEHSGIHAYCYTPMLFEQKMCFESDVEARTAVESAARSVQCLVEKSKVLWRVSVVKDHVDRHYAVYVCAACVAATCVLAACVAVLSRTQHRARVGAPRR
jgi:glycosyl transferase family 25